MKFPERSHVSWYLMELWSNYHMWDDQAKWVWTQAHHIFSFLFGVIFHSKSYVLQKTPLKLDMSLQSYDLLNGCQNNRKQKDLFPLFGININICKFRLILIDIMPALQSWNWASKIRIHPYTYHYLYMEHLVVGLILSKPITLKS